MLGLKERFNFGSYGGDGSLFFIDWRGDWWNAVCRMGIGFIGVE